MRKKSLTKQFGVLFSEETHAKLIRITDSREMPISKFIRKLVEAYLNTINEQEETSNEPSN